MNPSFKRISGGGKILLLGYLLSIILAGFIFEKYKVLHRFREAIGQAPERMTADYWAVKGWNNTIEKLDCQRDIVFFGNSITYMSNFGSYFPNVKMAVCGYPGDDLTGMLRRIPSIKYFHPKAVFAMGGINGFQDVTMNDFTEQYHAFAQMLLDSIPDADIYLESILPLNTSICQLKITPQKICQANVIIEEFAKSHDRCVYVDLFNLYERNGLLPEEFTEDGEHLLPQGYDLWAEAIRPYIEGYSKGAIYKQ